MYRFVPSELRAFRDRDWDLPRRLQDEEHRRLAERGEWGALLAVMDRLHVDAGSLQEDGHMAPRKTRTSRRTSRSGSVSPPSPLPRVALALEAVASAAKRLKVPWYLFGAQAVALYGVPRTTADVDVTLLWEADAVAVLAALRRSGIEPLVDDVAFIQQARVIPARHPASGWRLDVVLGGAGLEQRIAAEAVEMQIEEARVPVLRLEHLLVLKVLAQRPQDLADVARLLEVRGDVVRFDEVLELLSALEAGLGESGLLDTFERVRNSTFRR